MCLKGKTALVTGASRGIGRCIALELAARGAAIAVNYVAIEEQNERDAGEVVRECSQMGVRATPVEADVSDHGACQRMVRHVAGQLGSIDILVNNAGILRDRTLRKMTPEEWHQVLDVNLTGAFNVTSAALPVMLERGWGRIISLSSVIGVSGGFGQANYAASKAGVIGFTKSIAREVGAKGITANAVAPGLIDTGMLAAIPENVMAGYLRAE